MPTKKIKSALISVFDKSGLERITEALKKLDIIVYSTGGTFAFLEENGLSPIKVEDITSYPSILDGRVKTLHPKVFGGILARREDDHLKQLEQYEIPEIDLVVVDLYPFEATLRNTDNESEIIEKIDIGGIALIRAAAKNFNDVLIIPSKDQYPFLESILEDKSGHTELSDRKEMATAAFSVSSHYDTAIYNYFNREAKKESLKLSFNAGQVLRYGENPHQQGIYFGELNNVFNKRAGKELSFNNLVDIDAAVQLMVEFEHDSPTFAVLKHTNACGVATRTTIYEAWQAALAGDPVSAFGGILIANRNIDLQTAEEINKLFYEVLIAPGFDDDAFDLLSQKKKRVLLEIKHFYRQEKSYKSILNGVIVQDTDTKMEKSEDFKCQTVVIPSEDQLSDLVFANKLVKHLKSNTIVIAKNQQLLGMGCGQTSRVDAAQQAIKKARHFGFDLEGAVMASDAFFPFPDCVEIADNAGIKSVIQPGGSIKDQLSIDYCNEHGLSMVFTGTRHFKH
ncbi:MAG: bifunctional phosphoribosylaminoimidazolecarboxamide formyltransferase/IMP cyclohydrolase [Saprospiraceae bacterium]|nr:bifunctional phosphoribosylaminoimidazolecarboxamide formyltransferase/IMP cyclohydrolase [Bacteroidia bacterium]NNK89728.1 bifunctional phosphoribosylaminoimidazolecarboxamide formyltransferase/IMP cyclohydrolase [Saprospiraceae bacterium]